MSIAMFYKVDLAEKMPFFCYEGFKCLHS